MLRWLFALACFAGLAASVGLRGASAQTEPERRAAGIGQWPLETLRTKEGRVFRGYVQSANEREVEFVEVVRPPGKAMFLVVRPVPAATVAAIERLPEAQRKELAERIEAFQNVGVEAGAMESIELSQTLRDGRRYHVYKGPWFQLLAATEEEIARRAAVRIEQCFRAYRHAIPPRVAPTQPLQIILHGSMEEYRAYVAAQRLEIDHPAFYSAERNTIVAGADLAHYVEQLRSIRAENESLRKRYDALQLAFPQRQSELAEQLRRSGFNADEIREELRVRRKAWDDEYQAMQRKLAEVERRNASRFDDASRRLFARLRHEAFHAYVENFLYPKDAYAFPRWLNEGLAQVFESGRLDGDTLRIDAPDRELLGRLQADLAREPMPLAELLTADESAFLATHQRADASRRHYLYSWGVAWRLLFHHDLAQGDALTEYVTAGSRSPIERFETLAGVPLPEFERQWRDAMRELRPAPR